MFFVQLTPVGDEKDHIDWGAEPKLICPTVVSTIEDQITCCRIID